jgi:hypothetical protein
LGVKERIEIETHKVLAFGFAISELQPILAFSCKPNAVVLFSRQHPAKRMLEAVRLKSPAIGEIGPTRPQRILAEPMH